MALSIFMQALNSNIDGYWIRTASQNSQESWNPKMQVLMKAGIIPIARKNI
jgi:hypothetical protein